MVVTDAVDDFSRESVERYAIEVHSATTDGTVPITRQTGIALVALFVELNMTAIHQKS